MYKLGIIDCDTLAPELQQDYGSYALMFDALFRDHDLVFDTTIYSAVDGELPPNLDVQDAYLITGSKAGVYDTYPWIEHLRQFISLCYERGIKLIGFCFGHQIIADALGGYAQKSEKGWGIGLRRESINPEYRGWFGGLENIALYYSHQDQVVALPTNMDCLVSGDFCSIAAMIERNKVLTFQGHPEFSKDYLERLMRIRQPIYPSQTYQAAKQTLDQAPEPERVVMAMKQFFSEEIV